jgi:hypothetical protein
MSSKRMGSFNDPIDIVGEMVEEAASIAALQSSKDLTHMIFRNSHLFLQCPKPINRDMRSSRKTGIYSASLLLAALGHAGPVHLDIKVTP